MKNIARVELFEPGIIIFDPVALDDFLTSRGIESHDLFDFFINDEEVGRHVVEEGVIFPFYQIPEMEYSFFLTGAGQALSFNGSVETFCYSGIPLKVVSDIIVVADLNALMDWDKEFFTNYRAKCAESLGNNDYLDVESGFYSLSIKGYKNLRSPFLDHGYELDLSPVEILPPLPVAATVDDWDFSIV